jgi:hypothetical protein
MSLYSISGIGCNCQDDSYFGEVSIGRRTKAQRQEKKKARRYGEDCKGRTAAKYFPVLVAGRKAFLTLLSLNIHNMGTHAVLAFRNPTGRLRMLVKWCKFGGNAAQFKKTIAKIEARLKRKGKISYIGEPVTATTLIATALPIITAMIPILKQFAPEGSKAAEILEAAPGVLEALPSGEENVSGLGSVTDVKTLPEVVIVAPKRYKAIWLLAAFGGGFLMSKLIK